MNRDQRRSTRLPLEHEVGLISHDGILHHAITANLSLDGLYLQPSHLLIPLHHLVQINLRLNGRLYHIPAMVVHHDAEGMGVMFNRAEHMLYLAVCDLASVSNYKSSNSHVHLPLPISA